MEPNSTMGSGNSTRRVSSSTKLWMSPWAMAKC
jgi:hypothetical protein